VVELKIIKSAREISQSELTAIAQLHVSAMSETLSSIRGEKVVSSLYRRLLKNSGSIVVAAENDSVVGVLSFTLDHSKTASLSIILSRPYSWLRVTRKKGINGSIRELVDAYSVSRKVQSLDNQMLYITTLFVDSNMQNQGVATKLVDAAKAQAKSSNLPVVVDTRALNTRAISFYEALGMREFARTSMSVIFKY
jgi:ribosomal protein S18 acetylase RimI-like enzyme